MIKRYTGGIISAVIPTANANVASGFYSFTASQQLKQAGTWPSPIIIAEIDRKSTRLNSSH